MKETHNACALEIKCIEKIRKKLHLIKKLVNMNEINTESIKKTITIARHQHSLAT